MLGSTCSQKSKDDEGGSVRLAEKPVHHRPRILEARLNPTDVGKAHLKVVFTLHLRSCVFVKAACGRTARAVWAADGGQRLTARLLRPDYVRIFWLIL